MILHNHVEKPIKDRFILIEYYLAQILMHIIIYGYIIST